MLKKISIAIATATLVAIPAVPVADVAAQPPDTIVIDDYIVLFPDTNVNRSVFINITARDFCDWLATGPAGPPPAILPVTASGVLTGQGALVGKIDADLYIELWEFDDDPSPLIGPCEDIQRQLDAGDAPWATGTADWSAKSNDAFGSGTRGIAFGDRTSALVTDQAGNEYSYRNVFRLNEQCHAPADAPPSCLVDNSKLQMR